MVRRLLIASLLALAVAGPALAVVGPAGAGTIVVQLGLVPGKLALTAPPAAASAAKSVQVPVRIADGRGTGKGWTLRVSAARGVTVVGITAACAGNSTCTLPTASAGPSGSIVLKAATGTGMGIVNLVVTVGALPSGTPATSLTFSVS
jgi:hypothetical protein